MQAYAHNPFPMPHLPDGVKQFSITVPASGSKTIYFGSVTSAVNFSLLISTMSNNTSSNGLYCFHGRRGTTGLTRAIISPIVTASSITVAQATGGVAGLTISTSNATDVNVSVFVLYDPSFVVSVPNP